jgi:ABC-type nitrate/sulfonate/bicarbonate transport system substrate-binding protein
MRAELRGFTLVAVTVAALGLGGGASPAHTVALAIGVPGIPPSFLALPSYVAIERGFYARYAGKNAQISIDPFPTGSAEVQAVENGQLALAWVPTPVALAEMARGEPLVAIEGMDRSDWEIGSTDPTITTCGQLKGRTIGIDAVGDGRYDALVAMLASCGLAPTDVRLMGLPGSAGVNAQISGQLTLEVEHWDEAQQVSALGKRVTAVVRLGDINPSAHFAMLVTTKSELAANRQLLIGLLEGDIAATRWLYARANVAAAAKIAQITGDSHAVAAAAIAHYVSANWWDLGSSGLASQSLTDTIAGELQVGVVPAQGNGLTPAVVADETLWQSAQRAVG